MRFGHPKVPWSTILGFLFCLWITSALAFLVPTTMLYQRSSHYSHSFHVAAINKARRNSLLPLHLSSYNTPPPSKDSTPAFQSRDETKASKPVPFHKNSSPSPNHHNRKKFYHPYKKSLANKRQKRIPDDVPTRLNRANDVERKLVQSTEYLLQQIIAHKDIDHDEYSQDDLLDSSKISFPSVRDCNGALAIYGDTGDFKRALQLFGLMRKSVTLVIAAHSLQSKTGSKVFLCPPAPTLVTYSTLMSRAVALGKVRLALRLWRLMISSPSFYTNFEKNDGAAFGAPIVPDIRAVNILMNAFSKLGDPHNAKRLMEQLYIGEVVPYDASTEKNGMIVQGMDELVESAATGPQDLGLGLIRVVPKMQPNIVTYNTLIDACHRAGDLDAGLEALDHMKCHTSITPDIFTYTSLISTVARKATVSNGKSDPDLAFELFEEMVSDYNIRPNGMAYCALIDVCGRCRRSDLAMKGLRMMLREKRQRKMDSGQIMKGKNYSLLDNEVGAWTAAIDACGKSGRLDTAIRLFRNMPKFGVKPNIYTCGALTDCLLKSCTENYLDETLKVLRYMKQEGIEPSEFMYTSLITSASKFAQQANEARGEIVLTDFGDRTRVGITNDDDFSQERLKALDVYTELIRSLTSHNSGEKLVHQKRDQERESVNGSDELLVKVFLVLQEMKASGTDPDIACYNAILRACAKAGDVDRLIDVLNRIKRDGLIPNPTTWKELLRGASMARDSTMAEKFWTMALSEKVDEIQDSLLGLGWTPGADEFDLLLSSYIREGAINPETKVLLYNRVVEAYVAVSNGDEKLGFSSINIDDIKDKPRIVNTVYQAATFLRNNTHLLKDQTAISRLEGNLIYIERDLNLDLRNVA